MFLASTHSSASLEVNESQVGFVFLLRLTATSPGMVMGSQCTCLTCNDPAHGHRPRQLHASILFLTAEQTSRDTCQRTLPSLCSTADSLNPLRLS